MNQSTYVLLHAPAVDALVSPPARHGVLLTTSDSFLLPQDEQYFGLSRKASAVPYHS